MPMQPWTPGDDQQDRHGPDAVRGDEEQIEFLRIEFLVSVQRVAEPDADHMGHDEGGDAQAQHELEWLDRPPAELAALIERVDAEPHMGERGRIEHDRDGEEPPERRVIVDPDLHGIDRDVAERMVEEMAHHVREQDDAADQPNLPHAGRADKFGQS
ncbi:hypothetical protein ABIF64_009113 [Bradyrhizobium japonicum]